MITQGIAGRGTSVSYVAQEDGYNWEAFSWNDDMGRRTFNPANPKRFHANIDWVPSGYVNPVEYIYDSNGVQTGFRFTKSTDIYARKMGSNWMNPIAEIVDVDESAGSAKIKYYNSYNQQRVVSGFENYSCEVGVSLKWYPIWPETGTDIEWSQSHTLNFTGKLQANADYIELVFPPKPSGWGGQFNFNVTDLSNINDLTFTQPYTRYWIKQHA
jgi:hypothetical protein